MLPKGSFSEDSSSSESSALLEPLRQASSQPFDVPGASGPKENNKTLPSDTDDSLWGDDLNLGICDINDSVLTVQTSNKISSEGASVASKETDRSAELSSASADIFDDDLFSDSVILSTQAVEEAMTKKVTKDCDGVSVSKETHNKFQNASLKDRHQYQEKVCGANNSVKINRNCNNSEVSTYNIITSNSTPGNRIISTNKKQINANLDSSPQRQVRRSFRFGSSPKSAAMSSPLLVSERSNQTLTLVPKNQRLYRSKETRGELRKTDSLPVLNTEKSSLQNSSAPNLTSKGLSSAPVSLNNLNTQVMKGPIVKKSLFKSNVTKSEEIKHRSSIQAARGPLLRSHSSGDARITTSSPVGRRSNSSMELDTSQDLDDDEFFKSLLSMLPEEEEGFSVHDGVTLSPIKPENPSSKFQKSVEPSATMKHVPGNRGETRDMKFSKKVACVVPPKNCRNVLPQNLNNVPTQNQRNVPPQNVHNAPSQNRHNIPSRNVPNMLSQNLSNAQSIKHGNIPSRKLSHIPSQSLRNVPPQTLCYNPSQNVTKIPSQNLSNVSSQNLCNVTSQNLNSIPSQNVRRPKPQNAQSVPLHNVHSAPPQRCTSAPPQTFVNGSLHTSLERQVNQQRAVPRLKAPEKRSASVIQGVRPSGAGSSALGKLVTVCSLW